MSKAYDTFRSSVSIKEYELDIEDRDTLVKSITQDIYFNHIFPKIKSREQIQTEFQNLSDKDKFIYISTIYFCVYFLCSLDQIMKIY